MDSGKSFTVSWDMFHRDARALAGRLAGQPPFAAIVAVARGGLVPAAIVARELGIRLVETVCITSYEHMARGSATLQARGAGRHGACRPGGGLVIVDDVVDTGQTARVVRELLPRAHLASVYVKPLGRPLVDTFVTEVAQDAWIFFPWDTGLTFQKPICGGEG